MSAGSPAVEWNLRAYDRGRKITCRCAGSKPDRRLTRRAIRSRGVHARHGEGYLRYWLLTDDPDRHSRYFPSWTLIHDRLVAGRRGALRARREHHEYRCGNPMVWR